MHRVWYTYLYAGELPLFIHNELFLKILTVIRSLESPSILHTLLIRLLRTAQTDGGVLEAVERDQRLAARLFYRGLKY